MVRRVPSAAAVSSFVRGADWVVNLVGILHERRPGDFERLQGLLPERIGRAFRELAAVFLSSSPGDGRRPRGRGSKGEGL